MDEKEIINSKVKQELFKENIIIVPRPDSSQKYSIKIIDFGTANYLQEGDKFTVKVGSPFYLAPEIHPKHK